MMGRTVMKVAAWVLVCALVLATPVAAQDSISREEELFAGRLTAAQLITLFPVVADPDWVHFLASMRDTLAPFSGRTDIGHEIIILESDVPNAASAPGYLFVTTGMFRLNLDRDAWAFVVGHELGHTARRHVAMKLEEIRAARLLNVIVTVLTQSPGSGEVAEALSSLATLGHSREMELEADAEGLRMMTEAGFNPEKAATTLRYFNEVTGRRNENTHWAGTHPGWADRIAHLEQVRRSKVDAGFPIRVTYYTREEQVGALTVRLLRLVETTREWTVYLEVENAGPAGASVTNVAIRGVFSDGQLVDAVFLRSTLGMEIAPGTRITGTVVLPRLGGGAAPTALLLPLALADGRTDATLDLTGGGARRPKSVPSTLPRPPVP